MTNLATPSRLLCILTYCDRGMLETGRELRDM